MAFQDRLKERREYLNMSRAELAKQLNVTASAVGNYETGVSFPREDILYKIFDVLNVEPNYLWQDETKNLSVKFSISYPELNHIKKYRTLDEYGKKAVDAVLNIENERNESEPEQTKPIRTKTIPLLGNSFAAGAAEPDFGNLWSDYEVPIDSPAEFAIKINGKSMEPYLEDGSIALGVKRPAKIGEIIAVQINGESVCKQFCEDNFGNLYLFSLNRDYPDIKLFKSGNDTVNGIGTILISKKLPPLPDKINVEG